MSGLFLNYVWNCLTVSSVATSQLTPGSQTIRVQAPSTPGITGTPVLKATPASGTTKQIITVHKGGQVTSQPQIVTLVKTTQGMTVAQVCVSAAGSVGSVLVCI